MQYIQQISLGLALSISSLLSHAALPVELSKQLVGKTVRTGVTIKAPELAENGSVVPIKIGDIKLPNKDVHVTSIRFYSEANTNCPIASYKLTKYTLSEGLGTRIKLAQTTNVHALATLSDGSVVTGEKKIKITVGGCGGGGSAATRAVGNYCKK